MMREKLGVSTAISYKQFEVLDGFLSPLESGDERAKKPFLVPIIDNLVMQPTFHAKNAWRFPVLLSCKLVLKRAGFIIRKAFLTKFSFRVNHGSERTSDSRLSQIVEEFIERMGRNVILRNTSS